MTTVISPAGSFSLPANDPGIRRTGVAEVCSDPFLTAPPRLNFAGFCTWCDERGCVSPVCIARYESVRWAVCEACEGRGFTGSARCDECLSGVVAVLAGYHGPTVRGREVRS